jgi:hypothetical protein
MSSAGRFGSGAATTDRSEGTQGIGQETCMSLRESPWVPWKTTSAAICSRSMSIRRASPSP